MSKILTPARLATLKSWPHLSHNWHFLGATVLNTCNYTDEVPNLYKYALEQTSAEQHKDVTAKFREALLKSVALIGIPRVINGLTALKDATPLELRATAVQRGQKLEFHKEGKAAFAQIYQKITDRVHTNMRNAYPDLDWFVTNFEYGPLLSYMDILSPKETSLVIVSALVPQDVDPQLKGHLHGAINNGATLEEVNSTRDMAEEVAKWCGTTWRHPISRQKPPRVKL